MNEERRKDSVGVPVIGRRAGDFEHEVNAIRIALEAHIKAFELHDKIEKQDRERSIKQIDTNTQQIDRLTENTSELIEAWKALDGAIKFGGALGKLITWLSGIAVVAYIFHNVQEHFNK